MNELGLAAIFCALIAGGEAETQHGYSAGYDLHRIRVDCETADEVIEIALDKRGALDSVQQHAFCHASDRQDACRPDDRPRRAHRAL